MAPSREMHKGEEREGESGIEKKDRKERRTD
jgi:hypothetical protein